MQNNKDTIAVFSLIFLVIGLFLGWLFWGSGVISEPQMAHVQTEDKTNTMTMDAMMKGMVLGLEGKTGDAFDKAFLNEMITHHQGAVAMAEMVLQRSKRPELLQLTNSIITAQTKEIQMMQEWQKKWFK